MKPRRYFVFYILFAFAAFVIAMRLLNLQIVNGNYYREKSDIRTVRSVELIAPRGELLDRNGRAIVSNRTGYNVYILSSRGRTADELNKLIYNLLETVKNSRGGTESVLPISVENNKYVFSVDKKEEKKWKSKNGFDSSISAEKIMDNLIDKYKIDKNEYSKADRIYIAGVRLNMINRGFSIVSPYLFAEDVPIDEISVIKEQSQSFPNVSILTQPVRNYPYGSLGAHMLGRVGLISAEEYEQNEDNGYTINSRIGKDGLKMTLMRVK